MTAARILAARIMARLFRRHNMACGCLLCDPAEQDARRAFGIPARHPESFTRELPPDQEAELSEWAEEMWPDDEWTEIIIEVRRAEGQS
jgi:hypothetical protein